MVFNRSIKIIATSNETKLKIPKKFHFKTSIELAISPDDKNIVQDNFFLNKSIDIFNLCFVGVFEHRKGINIILEILKKLKRNNIKFFFNFYGDGTLKQYIQEFIHNENLVNHVKLHGLIPQKDVTQEMKKNHIFLFPSLRDSGGFVLFEAMSVGLPSIILKLGGPANIIDDNCGIIIDTKNKDQTSLIDEIYNNLTELIQDIDKLKKLSNNCYSRLKLFSWKSKINKIYGK